MLLLKFIDQFLNSGISRSCHTIVRQSFESLNIHQVVLRQLQGSFFGIHQVIRQVLNCHHVGFNSVRVVIFSPFFENTRIFSLVICCIFIYFIRPQVTNLLPLGIPEGIDIAGLGKTLGLGGPRQGTCEEVPEVPSPPRKMKRCFLPGSYDKMDGSASNTNMMQQLPFDIVGCEAYQICMPIRPDDTLLG